MAYYQIYQTGQLVLPAFLFEQLGNLFGSAEEFLVWQLAYVENATKGASISIDELAKRSGLERETIRGCLNSLIQSGSLRFQETSNQEGKGGLYYDATPLFERLDQMAADLEKGQEPKSEAQEFKDLLTFIQESYGRLLNPIEIEDLQKWARDFSVVLIKEAVRESVLNGKTSWRYWQTILRNWVNEGIQTVEQVNRRREEWNLQKTRKISASEEFKNNVNLWRLGE
ncbi:DnaD domain protein [Streptococcus sp. NLN64]|uniref:DnaD domain-containing protein n=1 Tax=Streptococcus sp. NLN64 TaxID=2822799 RepID=UPI0018CB3A9D|nr:DnaD domain protein [Streptococcus sp. NLN64]MBG9366582.1 DnaD domain protein [Streptococcus sp. NLN64]